MEITFTKWLATLQYNLGDPICLYENTVKEIMMTAIMQR